MHVMRIDDARPYAAAKHHDVESRRLHGFDASGAEAFWVGLSNYAPGGYAERDGTPTEKIYVVIDGEITVTTDEGEAALGPLDSVYFAPGEARAVENRGERHATMLVLMEYPPKAGA